MHQKEEKLQHLLQDFGIAMLATRTVHGELRSRPMVVADVQPDGTLWLLTDRHSGKMDEIAHDDRVNVTMQSATKFVSFSGIATAVHDRQKIETLWKETWKVWFPTGKSDPNLVLIRVEGQAGEYWDNSGTNAIRYLIEAGRAYLSGTRPTVVEPQMHAKVDLSHPN